MVYLGDFVRAQLVYHAFTTVDISTPGAPITWDSGSIIVQPLPIPGGSPEPDGATLDIDYFGPGAHLITVDLSAAQYSLSLPRDYAIVAAGGTVDGVDITGYVIAQFSVRNRIDVQWIREAVGLATANLDVQLGDIATKVATLPEGVSKAQPLANFEFFMALASDHVSGAEGKTITAERRRDGGAWEPCSNAVSEVELGQYAIDLDAADTDANMLTLRFTAVGCDPSFVFIKTSLT